MHFVLPHYRAGVAAERSRRQHRPWSARAARATPAAITALLASLALVATTMAGCKRVPAREEGKKILHYPLRASVGSLDPVVQSSLSESMVCSQVYEPLFTYEYLIRPYRLRPLLAAAMPEISADQTTYTITIKPGIEFHDDPCFPDGQGRELVAQDFIDSIKRMADRDNTPSGWWLYNDRIVGLDQFQARMNARAQGEPFDWDAEIAGLRALDRYRLQIRLERPFPQLLYILAMPHTAAVPRECAVHYGDRLASHPVGTGPFRLVEWVRGSRIVLERNPGYHDDVYPGEASAEVLAFDDDLLAPAGRRVPFLDGIVFHVFEQDQPMWLKFRAGDLDLVQVPAEYQPVVYDQRFALRQEFRDQGMKSYELALLDFIYRGFNMDDPLFGRGEKARTLRQAISLALDTGELNQAFYNRAAVLYDGPIPPGLDGHEPGVLSPYRGPNLDKARQLLARAGHPGGEGLPPLRLEAARTGNTVEQTEMVTRQLARIGIELEANYNSFPELQEKIKRRKAQFFNLAYGADYPDAESFLQMFYGPNATPGSNIFNYANPEYDRLYDRIRTMQPGPERTAVYEQMRDILIEDAPAIGSMARTRFYLWNPRLRNVMPSEVWSHWLKYLDIELER